VLTCSTHDADYHYYAERDEHIEASGVEEVLESHKIDKIVSVDIIEVRGRKVYG
jgi:hypothetical protein